jgi:chaperonin GroEL (HSP60 family)
VIQGLVLAKKRIALSMPKNIKNGSIMLVDGGIERRSFSSDMKLNVTTPGVLESFRAKEREMLTNQIDKLKELGIDVIACKEGIDDSVKSELAKLGIQAFRRVAKSDLDLLSKSCNATIVHDILSATKENVGECLSSSNKTLGGLEHWVVDAVGSGATIIIRGSTVDVIGEVERCFDDSLGVVCQMYEDDRLLPGGGATYVALARLLRRYAETIPDREQLAIEAYGDALEVIVRVLAENGGMDPIGSLLSVVSKQTSENSNRFGINLYTGEVEDMVDSGVIEPLGIVRQAIIGATEAAISILRIDDVLWAKQDIAIPELPGN